MSESGASSSTPPRRALAVEYLDFLAGTLWLWNETATGDGRPPMDVYLSPIVPAVAPRHGDYAKIRCFAYTAVANILDYSACTLPVKFVDPAIYVVDDPSLTKDDRGEAIPAPTCERDGSIRRKYDPKRYKGLPVALQVVGRRMDEARVVGVVKVIVDLLRKSEE